jgi:hypothetical protein
MSAQNGAPRSSIVPTVNVISPSQSMYEIDGIPDRSAFGR